MNQKSAQLFVRALNHDEAANRLAHPSNVSLFSERRCQFLVSDGRGLILRFLSSLRAILPRPLWH